MTEEEIKLDRYAKFRKLGHYEEFPVVGGLWKEAREERAKVGFPTSNCISDRANVRSRPAAGDNTTCLFDRGAAVPEAQWCVSRDETELRCVVRECMLPQRHHHSGSCWQDQDTQSPDINDPKCQPWKGCALEPEC